MNHNKKRNVFLFLLILVGCHSAAIAAQDLNETTAFIKLAQLRQAEDLQKQFSALFEKGEYEAALKSAREVFRIHQDVFGPDAKATAGSISDLAMVYNELGDYKGALRFYQLALKIRESDGGEEDLNTAVCMSNLAGVHGELGAFENAKRLYLRAIKIEEGKLGADHLSVAATLRNLGNLQVMAGEYADAQKSLKRVLKIQQKHLGQQHQSTANTHNSLGQLYQKQGNREAAEKNYVISNSIFKKLLPPNDPTIAISNNNLASLYQDQQDLAKAQPLFEDSLRIIIKRYGKEHVQTATALNNLATCFDRQQKFDRAIPLYEQSLAIRKKKFGMAHAVTATTVGNLGLVYKKQGKYDEAKSLCRQAMEIHRNVSGDDHPIAIASINQVAILEAISGNPEQGMKLFEQSQRAVRRHVTGVLPVLSPADQVAFLDANFSGGLFAGMSLAIERVNDPKSVLRSAAWLLNGKAIAHEAAAQRILMARKVNDPKLASVAKRLLRIREKLAVFAQERSLAGTDNERVTKEKELRAEEQELSEQLGQASLSQIEKESWVELKQVKQALSSDSVFIDIFRFDKLDFEATSTENQWLASRYAAWISHAGTDGTTTMVDLGAADEIDALVATLRADIASAAQTDGPLTRIGESKATEALKVQLKKLSDRLWKPIQPHLNKSKKVVISPDGPLWLVPWGALLVGADSDRYLVEDYELRLAISGRDLLSKPEKAGDTRAPIIVANPDFDMTFEEKLASIETVRRSKLPESKRKKPLKAAGTRRLPVVGALPMTAAEADAILPSLKDYSDKGVLFLKGGNALEVMVKSFPQPDIASFATHGFFLNRKQAPELANPLLRCGLLFCGSNDSQSSVAEDDGVLTGLEIVGLDYRGTKLVVLSACETGVGDIANGEGVAGLRQAFQLAGAQSVVASLWHVEDGATARLMNDFFKNIAAGKSKSESLRQAQLTRIKARRARHGAAHPFFWAAFTLTGQN